MSKSATSMASARPIHKDEFDSDSEEEEEEEAEAMAVGAPIIRGASKPADEEDDSDFEDPDEIEVPGGGSTLQYVPSGNEPAPSTSSMPALPTLPTLPSGSSLLRGSMSQIKPNNSLLKRAPAPAKSNVSIPLIDLEDDSGLEILKEIPGHSARGFGGPSMSSLAALAGIGGDVGGVLGANGFNPFLPASVLSAQDPFFMKQGLGGRNNPTDILQKSLQNGGLSRLMGMNPYSMSGMSGFPPGMNNYALGSGGGIMSGPLQSRQISNLWLNSGYRHQGESQEDEEVANEDEDDMGVIETYSNYWPSKLKIGKSHPDPVVETASLASVEPPDVWYDLSIPDPTIDEGKLSALQLESITYASQQHEKFLPDGNRAGFLIGDGAGVGKGRTIAGLIFENYCKGRKRAIWVSVSNDLKYDAERDLKDIGAGHVEVHFLSKMKYAKINSSTNNNVRKGVIYATYSALIGESQAGGKYKTRLKQLLHWCGEDFDGLILFDECHKAKNLCPNGAGKPTKTGQTVLELQQKLPKARIIYASATGASEPKHMAYMVRLGIWGPGSPFKDFSEFLGAVEKRGVGAMEIVAMDMKLRGMYIARQLSFQGVGFRVDEIEIPRDIVDIYNRSVDLWVDLLHKFEEAAALVDADKKMKKTMWGQYWSSHQRFFKYLCIAAKVRHVVKIASEVIKMGKCVVIGLQSTGEARTIEAIEREEELTDFVSTAKGVLQSLIEKHFPAPDRAKINRLLGKTSILDDLGIKTEDKKNIPIIPMPSSSSSSSSTITASVKNENGNGKRKPKRQASQRKKKMKFAMDSGEDSGSDFEMSEDEDEDDDDDDDDDDIDEDASEEDFNPFGSGSDDEDDPWARKRKQKRVNKKKPKKKKVKPDPFAHLIPPKKEENGGLGGALATPNAFINQGPPQSNVDRACQMKQDFLARIERLGNALPANTLDQLIDELGGPENVAEMTGRKGRVVQDENGDVRYESRSEQDIPLETLNLHEKDRFMRGEKDVAIISEAASSGISLQADRRVKNRKRRVHMTLELPWSADRAIQQFGRTHRSNQVSAPEYILLISDLAGEHRFASIVAKRLESLGALTHGDRRATESRDLSRFNIDNKYGRSALEATFKAIMGYESPVVKPPSDYKGEFFKDIADGLVGVGLITQSEDCPGVLTLDKGYNDISKFLNRILGMKVHLQNMLFKYFSDTLEAIISQAKRSGKYDQGILDVGVSEEDHVELVRTHSFKQKHATGTAKIELHVLHVERGMSWDAVKEKWEELVGVDEGFYVSHQVRNGKKTAILAVQVEDEKRTSTGGKREKKFLIYRPNTGQQVKQEALTELKKKYKKVGKDEAESHWKAQYQSSVKTCSHAYWKGNCKNMTMGMKCEIGLRRKTYNVLCGSVLSVWTKVEEVLTHDGNRRGAASKMQVVRLKLENDKRIVGSLIPNSALTSLLKVLSADSQDSEETIY